MGHFLRVCLVFIVGRSQRISLSRKSKKKGVRPLKHTASVFSSNKPLPIAKVRVHNEPKSQNPISM